VWYQPAMAEGKHEDPDEMQARLDHLEDDIAEAKAAAKKAGPHHADDPHFYEDDEEPDEPTGS
jgi:hypothetical protein